MSPISRRKLITTGIAATAGVAGVAVAAKIASRYGPVPPDCRGIYGAGETMTYATQRLLTRHSMAREFSRSMISTMPFANQSAPPDVIRKLQPSGLLDWRVAVDGMVAHPLSLSLAELRAMEVRSQITEVVCEEGWSYIAEWIGTPLSNVLQEAGILPQARYVVYHTIEADVWDSLDLADALHPQTLVTYGMNDGDLPVRFGGPVRMRVPRQLGYKSLKYILRLTVTDSMKKFGKGVGSGVTEWGYAWYAGI